MRYNIIMKEKFRKVILMIGILITAAGLCLAMYATVSNWYCEYTAGNEIEIYSETVRNTSQDELRHIKENVIEYNHSLASEESKSSISYDEMLAATDAIGYLEIPRLQLMLPIYEGTEMFWQEELDTWSRHLFQWVGLLRTVYLPDTQDFLQQSFLHIWIK